MAFPWAAVIGAGASIGGGLLQSAGAAAQNQAQRDIADNANVAAAERAYAAQQFSEYMSNTAYQRTMKDMKAAGLNPILAYQQGGASTPQGVMAPVQMAQLENEMEGLGEGVSSAAQAAKDAESAELAREQSKRTIEETKNTTSQTELNKANEALSKTMEEKSKVDAVTSASQASKLEAEKNLADEQTRNAKIQAGILAHNVTSAAADARIKLREATDAENYGTSTTGRELGGMERVIRRMMDAARNRKAPPAGGAHSAYGLSGSAIPKALRGP